MSTFFEKLTGSGAHAPAADPAPSKAEVQKRIKRPQEEKPTHLKVAHEDEPEEKKTRHEAAEEEEGELTVDIYDKEDSIVIQSTVAGVKPEDLDVSITTDTVTIRGKRKREEEVSEKHYYYKELFWGTFSRTVILPEEIEDDEAEAALKHGLLTIVLPKKRKGVVQKLKVKVT